MISLKTGVVSAVSSEREECMELSQETERSERDSARRHSFAVEAQLRCEE